MNSSSTVGSIGPSFNAHNTAKTIPFGYPKSSTPRWVYAIAALQIFNVIADIILLLASK